MRCFLLKINPENCPSENGTPKIAVQWEGVSFISQLPRKSEDDTALAEGQTTAPQVGDQILVWVNETPRPPKARGSGLTAKGTVGTATPSGKTLELELNNIELLKPPRVTNDYLERFKDLSVVANRVRRKAHESLSYLSHEEFDELLMMANARVRDAISGSSVLSMLSAQAPTANELAEWQAERQLTWKKIELRANQGAFRDQVLARDGARCAVTGCETAAVLEAAHLIPFASGHPERDNPANGILLRSDIHTLFDRGLMGVSVASSTLWVSPKISELEYRRLDGRQVVTGAAQYNLEISLRLSLASSK